GVDALADRGDRHLRVQVVRHSGHHRVDIAGIEHGDVVVVEGGARVLLGGDVLLGRVGVGDGAEGHPLDLAVGEDAGVRPALGAESDDPEADVLLRHGVSVLWWVLAPRRARWMRWADVQDGGPPVVARQGWGPLRPYWRGPVEDRRREAVSAGSARPRRRPRACRTAVTRTSSSCSSWLVLTWRRPPRYGRRPGPACSPRGGPTGGQAVRVWPGERGRRESCRRLHEDGRATREGDPAVGKLRRGRAAITCGAVRTRRERSVEVQEGLQDLRGVLVDLV